MSREPAVEELLDRISSARHDVLELIDRLNAFEGIPDDDPRAQDGIWLSTGLAEAQHPLTALCPEGHNTICVVRDLDGSLQFIFDDVMTPIRWQVGPATSEHFSMAADALDDEQLQDMEIPLSGAELAALIAALPEAPGPVRSY